MKIDKNNFSRHPRKAFWRMSILIISLGISQASEGSSPAAPFVVALEAGPVWQNRNDVRIPGNEGTRFSLTDLTGGGPFLGARFQVDWNRHSPHQYRITAAPFRVGGTSSPSEDLRFNGQTFLKGVPAKGTYRFDTYRLTYRYMFGDKNRLKWNAGGTLLIRDAEIKLEQARVYASKKNVGFVPLFHFSGHWGFTDRLRAQMEFDGLAGGPGRAFDFALQGLYSLSDRWDMGLGYRTIEGGSDTDSVYTFGWFNALNLIVACKF